MKLIETNITQNTVKIRYEDTQSPSNPESWVELQVPLNKLKLPSDTPLGNPKSHYLATIREVALRYVRDAFDAEIGRLATLRNQGRG